MHCLFSHLRPARTHRHHAAPARKAVRRSLPTVELMEGRQILSTFTVTNTNDSGPGSLRAAIIQLNTDNNTTPDTINFQLSGNSLSQYRIALQTQLPGIFRPVTIDATSLEANVPGATGPVLELDGNAAGTKAVGLQVYTVYSTIAGLAIDGFAGGGLQVDGQSTTGVGGGSGNTFANLSIGVTNADTVSANGTFGVELINGAHNNTFQDDVIAGNQGSGVVNSGAGTNSNIFLSDYIGNDTQGRWFRNNGYGVQVVGGSSNNQFLYTYAVDNANAGIYFGPGSSGNYVYGSNLQSPRGQRPRDRRRVEQHRRFQFSTALSDEPGPRPGS